MIALLADESERTGGALSELKWVTLRIREVDARSWGGGRLAIALEAKGVRVSYGVQ